MTICRVKTGKKCECKSWWCCQAYLFCLSCSIDPLWGNLLNCSGHWKRLIQMQAATNFQGQRLSHKEGWFLWNRASFGSLVWVCSGQDQGSDCSPSVIVASQILGSILGPSPQEGCWGAAVSPKKCNGAGEGSGVRVLWGSGWSI